MCFLRFSFLFKFPVFYVESELGICHVLGYTVRTFDGSWQASALCLFTKTIHNSVYSRVFMRIWVKVVIHCLSCSFPEFSTFLKFKVKLRKKDYSIDGIVLKSSENIKWKFICF